MKVGEFGGNYGLLSPYQFLRTVKTPIIYQCYLLRIYTFWRISFLISNLISPKGEKEMNISDKGIGGLFQPLLKDTEGIKCKLP